MRKDSNAEVKAELATLTQEIAEARAEISVLVEQRGNTEERNRLAREVNDLKIEKSKIEEGTARQIRETEHKVGLLQKQQEQDKDFETRSIDIKVQEAKLEVREENLDKDKQRFEDQQKFEREQLTAQIDRVDNILKEVLKRLPNVTAAFTHDHVSGNGSGYDEDRD